MDNYLVLNGKRALHEILNRLLWRFSMEHNNSYGNECYITINIANGKYNVLNRSADMKIEGGITFKGADVAQQAVEEIIKPFIKKHPEFVW